MSTPRLAPMLRTTLALTLMLAATTSVAPPVHHDDSTPHRAAHAARWSAEQRETLRSLSLASLGALPADPSNRYADDTAAAALGRRLFFDTRLSGNGKVSCGSCHLPEKEFQDGT